MIPTPSHFPNDNSHRVALFMQPTARDDFDRLEELTADGIRSARKALEDLTSLAIQFDRSTMANLAELQHAIEKRRLLNDRFVDAATELCAQLSDAPHADPCAEIASDLKQAISLSNRVRDLLAAERDVGWHRGIRD